MDPRFKDVKCVGFDLDQTCYEDKPEYNALVKGEIYRTVSKRLKKPEAAVEKQFLKFYDGLGSTSKALGKMGIKRPAECVRDCLDRAGVEKYLERDERLCTLLKNLRTTQKKLFVVTDSRKMNAIAKMTAIGIEDSFDYIFCWDTQLENKTNGRIFSHLIKYFGKAPQELLFVGNSVKDDIIKPAKFGWNTIYISKNHSPHATACIGSIYDLENLLL